METVLDEVCGYLKNYFLIKPGGIHRGTFTVTGGTLSADFLQDGQYFRVRNSVFNDGVYKYPASDMVDETFTGEVWAMGVPPAFIALLDEIEAWEEKYGGADSVNMSPFSSESFNNYSYTKRSGGSGNSSSSGDAPATWMDVYGSKLVRWKKI